MSRIHTTKFLLVLALFAAACFGSANALATPYYWDINGAAAGAGGATPAGTWSTGVSNWTTDSTGSSATAVWTNTTSRAVFSAGTDATGNFIVTASGTPVTTMDSFPLTNITVASGNITLNGSAISVVNTTFGAGFNIASGASLTLGTATITRSGVAAGSVHTYLNGGGTLYMPGFTALAANQTVVVDGGAWDFGTGTGFTRLLAQESTIANPGVFQGSGTLTRPLAGGGTSVYWSAGSSGGFAARGGQLDVTLTSTLTFGAANNPANTTSALILGSPTADSLVDYKSNISLASAAQNIMAWNPNNIAGNIARVSGVISSATSAGALTKLGTGTLQLTAANTYTGTTTVSAGKLMANNTTGSATGTNAVTVNLGATLGGTGSITGTVNVFGTIGAGSSNTESLATGALTMQTGSEFDVELGGLTAGATVNGYDQVSVTGSVTLNNATLDLTQVSFTAADGDTFFILANDSTDAINGVFNGLANDSTFTAAGRMWKIRYNADFSTLNFNLGSGNDIALQAMPIPEPSMFAMLAVGSVVGISARRRRMLNQTAKV